MNAMMMQKLMEQSDIETTPAPAVARQVAEREKRMAETLDRLADATGAEIEPVAVDVEQRTALLLEAAEAIMSQSFGAWWWEVIGPEVLDRPDLATEYAGLSPDEWHETVRGWYQNLYESDRVDQPVEEASREEIGRWADKYVRSLFGLSLREFVAVVVNWSPQRAVQDVLAGPSDEMMRQFDQVAEDVDA